MFIRVIREKIIFAPSFLCCKNKKTALKFLFLKRLDYIFVVRFWNMLVSSTHKPTFYTTSEGLNSPTAFRFSFSSFYTAFLISAIGFLLSAIASAVSATRGTLSATASAVSATRGTLSAIASKVYATRGTLSATASKASATRGTFSALAPKVSATRGTLSATAVELSAIADLKFDTVFGLFYIGLLFF